MPEPSSTAPLRPLDHVNSGVRIPASRLVKDNPKAAALISKLTTDQRAQIQADVFQQQGAGLNTAGFRAISQEGMQNVNDAETIQQLLSDTELAAQILISVILSPKDMMGIDPGFKAETVHWQIPHEVMSSLTNAVRDYFEHDYKIKPRLPTILHDALFTRGCYPVAVLPENAIDDMIHGNGSLSTEAHVRDTFKTLLKSDGQIEPIGILGPLDKDMPKQDGYGGYARNTGLALEHLLTHRPDKQWKDKVEFEYQKDPKSMATETFDTFATVTDNLHVLKIPRLRDKLREQRVKKLVGSSRSLSTEAIAQRIRPPGPAPSVPNIAGMNVNPASPAANVFHNPNLRQTLLAEIKPQEKLKRRSIGLPMEIHFPSESVIPVHVPNQPSKQIGFFVLLDGEGNPVNRGLGVNHYRELGQSLQANGFASAMIQRAGLALSDNSDSLTRGGVLYNTTARMYGQMLDRDLKQRLKNGMVGDSVSIASHDEVYRLMLARSLANQQTQILYIPAEYMTYIAFDYKTNGTGKSLLDNTKIIDSMQANMLVGTVMGALRNSIGRTHVDLKLDPDHPDPWKAVETMMGEIMRVNGNGFPLGTIDPLDIKDGLVRSQFEFGFSGHPKLPDMTVDFTEKNSNYNPPDSKVMDDLRKRRLMSFYLTPEQVDAASGADYATSVANNSTLLSKRAMVLQQEFTPQVSAHLRKHAINSADLIDKLVEIIAGSYDDILKEFKDDEKIIMMDGEVVTKAELKDDPLAKGQFIREIIEDFLGGFTMTLPEPDGIKLDNQNEQYKKQVELIEEALKVWISTDMMDASIVGEELANHVNVCREQIKSFFLREWMVKNGVMAELSRLTARGEDGEVELDMAEIQSTHNESMMEVLTALLTANKKAKEKNAKALEKAGVAQSDGGYGGGSSDYGSSDGGSGGGSDFGGGSGDDFSLDMPSLDEGGGTEGNETPAEGEAGTEPGPAEAAANANAEPAADNADANATSDAAPENADANAKKEGEDDKDEKEDKSLNDGLDQPE